MKVTDPRDLMTTGVASAMVVVGLAMLFLLIRDGTISADAGLALITTMLGAAMAHLFSADAAQRSVRSYERAQNGVSEKIQAAADAVGRNGTGGTAA